MVGFTDRIRQIYAKVKIIKMLWRIKLLGEECEEDIRNDIEIIDSKDKDKSELF